MGILGPQLIGLRRSGNGERLVGDDLHRADARARSAAICASTVGRLVDADLLVGVRLNVARSWAVPNPALAGGGVLTATAAPTTTAATATTISNRIRAAVATRA